MSTNIENLEKARDYLDKLIDEAEEQIAELDRKIAENERLIIDCINTRKMLEAKDKEANENA